MGIEASAYARRSAGGLQFQAPRGTIDAKARRVAAGYYSAAPTAGGGAPEAMWASLGIAPRLPARRRVSERELLALIAVLDADEDQGG